MGPCYGVLCFTASQTFCSLSAMHIANDDSFLCWLLVRGSPECMDSGYSILYRSPKVTQKPPLTNTWFLPRPHWTGNLEQLSKDRTVTSVATLKVILERTHSASQLMMNVDTSSLCFSLSTFKMRRRQASSNLWWFLWCDVVWNTVNSHFIIFFSKIVNWKLVSFQAYKIFTTISCGVCFSTRNKEDRQWC